MIDFPAVVRTTSPSTTGGLRPSCPSQPAGLWRIRLAAAYAAAMALEVSLHPSNIVDRSSVSLCRGAASIENLFAPFKGRDCYSDHENQGESDANDDSLAASHVSRIYACSAPLSYPDRGT